jgi:hypothetical protein
MDAITSHRQAFKWAAELLEMTMADVTAEQACWRPPGIANPLGATYAHALCDLDGSSHAEFGIRNSECHLQPATCNLPPATL